jgi:hypothetical protein
VGRRRGACKQTRAGDAGGAGQQLGRPAWQDAGRKGRRRRRHSGVQFSVLGPSGPWDLGILGRRVRTAADSERKVNPPAVAGGARTDASRGAARASASASASIAINYSYHYH